MPDQLAHVDDDFGLIIAGTQAQELLDNKTFVAVINDLIKQISDAILNTKVDEINTRQNLYMLYKATENLVLILKASAATKPLVSSNLEALEMEDVETTDLTNIPIED